MELKFKEQQYQIDAVNSLVRCFSGQPKGNMLGKTLFREHTDFGVMGIQESDFNAFANADIDYNVKSKIINEVQELQKEQGIPVLKTLDIDNGNINFTIEMETGTGKTYVYTRSIFELNKQYGWSKFIIMVPSIAIREGVYKSLKITANHFQDIYGKKIRFFIYDTKNTSNLSNIKNFAYSSNIEVMVMNYQAFASNSEESKKIYQRMDATNSIKPIHIISGTRPILIIDEPQKFGKVAESKMQEFNPLFIVRYSATHEKDYNKIYRLDAIDAYNQKLVKRIAVKGIETIGSTGTNSYMFLDRINVSTTKYPTAHIRLEIESKENGQIKKVLRELKEGDNLYEISNYMKQYEDDYVINRIDAYNNVVTFINGVEIRVGQVLGNIDEEHIRRIQIRETILEHLEKERLMFHKGIKVLSLFFIDEVKKYRDYDKEDTKGTYAHIFEEEYQQALNEKMELFDIDYNKYLKDHPVETIHNGYFSIDKKGHFINSKEGKDGSSDDVSAYDLIMKNKERLLDLNEPTRFIFSHSALSEGWDNPNIFQICTLKESSANIRKRQEIGRGLRICVDKNGFRQDSSILGREFFDVNTLTVIASESYDSFSKSLQKEVLESISNRPTKLKTSVLIGRILKNEEGETKEITEELAMDIITDLKMKGYIDKDYSITEQLINDIDNNKFQVIDDIKNFKSDLESILYKIHSTANYKSSYEAITNVPHHIEPNENFKKKEFQELWNKLKIKTAYEVDFDSKELIEKSVKSINEKLKVKNVVVKIVSGTQDDEISEEKLKEIGFFGKKSKQQFIKTSSTLGNVKYDLIGEIAKSTNLTRKTVVEILQKISEDKFKLFGINPEDFIRNVSVLINEEKATTLINGITYSPTGEVYGDDIFTINNFSGSLKDSILEVKKHVYDFVKCDSEVEKRFAKDLEKGEICVYAKLPRGFLIPTPMGNYNPDWAIVMDKKDVKYIYFIAETKGSMSSLQLSASENLKIGYAKKHFESLNTENLKYNVITSYEDLMREVF